jgi:hypothetical protein
MAANCAVDAGKLLQADSSSNPCKFESPDGCYVGFNDLVSVRFSYLGNIEPRRQNQGSLWRKTASIARPAPMLGFTTPEQLGFVWTTTCHRYSDIPVIIGSGNE